MFQYFYRDIASMMRFAPLGLAIGIPLAMILTPIINKKREKREEKRLFLPFFFLWCICVAVILAITLLSRESGSSNSTMDLKLFSTFGINRRNDAYIAENIVLFIPYGLLSACNFKQCRNPVKSILIGFAGSLFIESMQLITGRGIFQIDDIMTNTVGMLAGCILYHICNCFRRKKDPK